MQPSNNATDNEIDRTALPRNFAVLAFYQVILRVGWIFKTESIVMPAVVDMISGSAWARGMLPLLSRFAIAIPPIFAASTIRDTRRKKFALALVSFFMGCCFLVLAFGWRLIPRLESYQSLGGFLTIYTVFFICVGLNHVCFGTLQGKLIPADLRGRLMSVANVIGASMAIAAVWYLLPRWLGANTGQFQYIFGFTGTCFLVTAGLALLAMETPDVPQSTGGDNKRLLWNALLSDRRLQTVAVISMLANSSILLFPHYQNLARLRLDLDFRALLGWLIVQNIGTAVFGTVFGGLADWRGNRLALRIISGGLALIPPLALWISRSGWGAGWFHVVFLMIGLTPIFMRLVQHYTLELAPADQHPEYLATINLCNALPFVFSPLVGTLVDRLGFDLVFLAVNAFVLCAFLLTWRMVEPRTSSAG